MGTFISFTNCTYFIILILILYIVYTYYPLVKSFFTLLFPNNLIQIENFEDPASQDPASQDPASEDTSNKSSSNQNGTTQDPSAVVVPGEDILNNLLLKATNNNNSAEEAYINDYLKINNEYKQILTQQQAQQQTTEYKSNETYAPTFPNRMISKIANSGLPFMGYFSKLYVPYPDSTKCHGYGNNFDGWCQKEYGNNKDFGLGTPSQLVSGQVVKYPGGCPGGLMGAGGQGRAQCAFGYAGLSKLPLNSTQCYLTAGGDFDKACRDQAGSGHDYKQGIMSDYIFGVKNYLPDGKNGCWAGQRRAECGLGYAGGYKLKPNSTMCKLNTTDWDGECRTAGGTDPGYGKNGVPSQETWGQKSLYKGKTSGCIIGQNRAECGKGYSAGEKLLDNSTKCYLWTAGFNGACQNDYGSDWILDTRESTKTELKALDKGADYGKYNGGCIGGQGRGVCVKKSDIKDGDTLVGSKCGAWLSIANSWCSDDYGDNMFMSGKKQYDCLPGFGRATCVKAKTKWTDCSNNWWGWSGGGACKKAFGDNSAYAGNTVDCGKHGGAWYTSKYNCATW